MLYWTLQWRLYVILNVTITTACNTQLQKIYALFCDAHTLWLTLRCKAARYTYRSHNAWTPKTALSSSFHVHMLWKITVKFFLWCNENSDTLYWKLTERIYVWKRFNCGLNCVKISSDFWTWRRFFNAKITHVRYA